MKKSKKAGIFIAAVGSAAGVGAQGLPESAGPSPVGSPRGAPQAARLGVSASVDGWFPAAIDSASDVAYGLGGTAQVSYAPLPFVEALGRAGVYSLTLNSRESLLYVGGSAGLGFAARLFERMSVGVSAFAGLGKAAYGDTSSGLYELGARLETSFRLTAAMSLGVSAGYERLGSPNAGTFLDALSASVRLRLSPEETSRDRVNLAFEKVETQAIFPVFRSWYDSEPLGSVTIRNDEDGPIDNVRVSFFAPEYMGGPRLCTTVKRLERGQSATVPLYAVFDERVPTLTENGSTSAAINVQYSFLGSRRTASEGLSLSLHHRNAMSWEDDRRAAAFVSPTDPAALWFSRYSSSIVRDRMRTELPPNLQYALGIFEALKLYGLNYVIDPNSAYAEMSSNEAVIDYLQYPSQTLMYRGGDCDDLSILYCSLLESSGIATAFITIPGHIYMAFDLGLSEAEARERFFDPGLLLFRDGRAWAPVEITMVKEGFVKAWRVGAKQWIDNNRAGSSGFFAMKDNWAKYKPSGLQDAAARFALPDEAKAMAAFDAGVDRFVSREIEPVVAEYEKKLASKRAPETLNEYGVAMARVGMLDPAWERFVEATKAGYAWSWNNLANIAFVRKDYALAYSYYEWATTLLPGDPVAVLGMARCAYELDRYSESAILYEGLAAEAPALAAKNGYLASAYGGAGRAWSMADRLSGSVWSKPGLSFDLPAAAGSQAAVAAAPPPTAAKAPPAPLAPAPIVPAPLAVETAPAQARGSAMLADPDLEPESQAAEKAVSASTPSSWDAIAEAMALAEAEAASLSSLPAVTVPEPIAEPAAIVAAPEPIAEPAAIVAAPEPIAEPAALAPAPEPVSEPIAIVAAPEPVAEPAAIVAAPEPVSEPAALAPAPVVEPEARPQVSATFQALAAAKALAQEPKAAGQAPAPRAPTVLAPPAVVEKPPEDIDIASKALEVQAPPTVVAAPPVDQEIAQKATREIAPEPAIAPPSIPSPVAQAPAEELAPVAVAPAVVAPVAEAPVAVAPPPVVIPVAPAPAAETRTDDDAELQAIVAARAAAQATAASAKAFAAQPAPAPVAAAERPEPAPIVQAPEPAKAEAKAVVPETVKPEPIAAPAPVVTPEPIVAPEPSAEIAKAEPGKPRFAPSARFAPTVDRGTAPAFGKRLPEGADASGYERVIVVAPTQGPYLDMRAATVKVGSGAWTRAERKAEMTDAKAMSAKLVVPTPGLSGPAAYEFKARAEGSGWVGFGLHLHGRGKWKLSGYGGGDSILVWITSNPKAYGDDAPRLQVYRSSGEVAMRLVASQRIAGSAFELRDYKVEYDPASGVLAVFVDGAPSLSVSGLKNPSSSDYAALRALDLAEFSDIRITPLTIGPKAVETTP